MTYVWYIEEFPLRSFSGDCPSIYDYSHVQLDQVRLFAATRINGTDIRSSGPAREQNVVDGALAKVEPTHPHESRK